MDNQDKSKKLDPSEEIYQKLSSEASRNEPIETDLTTDERVFARITDGIYRTPSSAIRELISNAYDADATEVIIRTDYPRFATLSVKDNGNGLSKLSVARLVKHIGGSSKRTALGKKVGTSNDNDPTLSPKGRKLIGKIGIGLFAVAQLTQSFRIITKQAGESDYIVVDIILKQYKEDDLLHESNDTYKSGSVKISLEKTQNINEHGTEIILHSLKPAAIRELTSYNWWLRFKNEEPTEKNENEAQNEEEIDTEFDEIKEEITKPPVYHIGRIDTSNNSYIKDSAILPWSKEDSSEVKFRKLVNAVSAEQEKSTENPSIGKILDNYLQMIWNISLSAPVQYLDFNPWKTSKKEGYKYFKLSNKMSKGQVEEITADFNEVAEILDCDINEIEDRNASFKVYIDGLQISRPIIFDEASTRSNNSIKDKIFFYGDFEQDLSRLGEEYSGGKKLKFRATAFWNSVVSPIEHRGVLIRVNNASGNVFDPTFLGYQVSEQSRLRQIVFEINVIEGLDAAINIDRESFNFAHPHYQIIQRWLHSAIRQIVNRLKSLARDASIHKKTISINQNINTIQSIGDQEWNKFSKDKEISVPPSVKIFKSKGLEKTEIEENIQESRKRGDIAFDEDVIIPEQNSDITLKVKIEALAKVLHGFGVFEEMEYDRQQEIIRAIIRIFTSVK
jgi:hypothetical protein